MVSEEALVARHVIALDIHCDTISASTVVLLVRGTRSGALSVAHGSNRSREMLDAVSAICALSME
jgi:hypothetical protein